MSENMKPRPLRAQKPTTPKKTKEPTKKSSTTPTKAPKKPKAPVEKASVKKKPVEKVPAGTVEEPEDPEKFEWFDSRVEWLENMKKRAGKGWGKPEPRCRPAGHLLMRSKRVLRSQRRPSTTFWKLSKEAIYKTGSDDAVMCNINERDDGVGKYWIVE